MSFDAKEISQASGQPVELFEISVGSTNYLLTSHEDEIVVGLKTYSPEQINRGEIQNTMEDHSDGVQVELPATHAFVQMYVNLIPSDRPTLKIFKSHRTDTPTPEVIQIFDGFVQSVGFFNNGSIARLSGLPATASVGREIPRFMYQGVCNHILYDARCQVSDASFKFTGACDTVSGISITVNGLSASKGSGWATGGHIEVPGVSDQRLIIDQTGDVLTLRLPFRVDVLDEVCNVFAGCAHTVAICKSKFNNVLNYGGFPFVPLKNPFEVGID